MNRSTTAAATRAIALAASAVLWTVVAAVPALAAPSHSTAPEPQAPAAQSPSSSPEHRASVTSEQSGQPGSPTLAAAPSDTSSAPPVLRRQTPATTEDTAIDWTAWSYGARGIVTLLRQESLNSGFGVSGVAVLPLTTDLELEGEIGFATMSTETDGLPTGRLTVFPLRGTLRVQLWRFGGAEPYAGAGAGVYINRFSLDPAVEQDLAQVGFGASASVDPALGFHAAGGIEWRRDRVHFGVDVKYVFGDADAVSTVVDQVTQQVLRETSTVDLDGFWIAAGARFDF